MRHAPHLHQDIASVTWRFASDPCFRRLGTATHPGPAQVRLTGKASGTAGDTVRLAQKLSADESAVGASVSLEPIEVDVEPGNDPVDKRSLPTPRVIDDHLLERAREEDPRYWNIHRRPVSADTLRKKLHIGAARSRLLVATIRAEGPARWARTEVAEVTVQAGV
ncbi:hypothetical protein [Saccharothrix variisporea]|uniref:hypothetical protein n=1 Tax=Saccharothrix variisporea TaxID=543527 RepID=UPI001B872F79|nr:hypothetical protein [Saccharothrix variisporea]